MRGLVFWLVVFLTISGGSWLYTQQERKVEMLPLGSKLLATGDFSLPVGGTAKIYHLPDNQGRIVMEKLQIDKGFRLAVYLTHNPNAADVTAGSLYLGEVKDARIQALDIPPQARGISYSSLVLVRTEQNAVWSSATLVRAY